MWDDAAPSGVRAAVKKQEKGAHAGTIIEQLIAAANSDGASENVYHNSTAEVTDERAIELLEPIEKHMHPDFFPMK
jgi:uncharacterized membrane protein YebE (DUF533 family)